MDDRYQTWERISIRKEIGKRYFTRCNLSPLLFVLCMDPLSRKLNGKYQKVSISLESGMNYTTNHLLFIDDLKLLSESAEELERMMSETKDFFEILDLILIKKVCNK